MTTRSTGDGPAREQPDVVLGAEQRDLGVGVGGAQGGQRGLGDDVVAEAVGPQHREAPDVGDRGSGRGGQAEGGAGVGDVAGEVVERDSTLEPGTITAESLRSGVWQQSSAQRW